MFDESWIGKIINFSINVFLGIVLVLVGLILAGHLLSSAVGALVLITCISFCCQFVAVGNLLFIVWPKALPYLLASGYVVIVVFMPICEKIAVALTR